jgi:hypothetical protein
MSEAEAPTWEAANGFTARGVPIWRRQATGAVLALLLGGMVGLPDVGLFELSAGPSQEYALRALGAWAVGWLMVAFVIRHYIAVGWRVVDEVEIDFKTSALRLAQRRVRGRRMRTVQAHQVASVREISFGSYRGQPLDWFVFKLKAGEKIRFRCPSGILAMTRKSLQRAGLLNPDSLKGIAVQPAAAVDVTARRR